ncbi:eotaxin-like isoform X1 [Labeo rohita]|uniref:Eotaxin-like isoform X1 n=1 Tax=Labeo rohita TaxID=84645 RepID=A0A498NMY7_LABRO|nr:eotaxin-like isoform X1 [Labeo rohita]
METQRILMRSLAVAVVLAAVIWTTTVSTSEVIEPIISFRRLKEDLPCLKAVIFETERGYFCSDWRQPWVKRKILQFLKDKPKKSQKDLTSTPPPTSTIRDQTRVGETTQAIDSRFYTEKDKFCSDPKARWFQEHLKGLKEIVD